MTWRVVVVTLSGVTPTPHWRPTWAASSAASPDDLRCAICVASCVRKHRSSNNLLPMTTIRTPRPFNDDPAARAVIDLADALDAELARIDPPRRWEMELPVQRVLAKMERRQCRRPAHVDRAAKPVWRPIRDAVPSAPTA